MDSAWKKRKENSNCNIFLSLRLFSTTFAALRFAIHLFVFLFPHFECLFICALFFYANVA